MSDLAFYSEEEFSDALSDLISTLLVHKAICPVDRPRGILLGGQSGAGKSTLHMVYKRELANNVIVINGDEYRSAHPRFAQIQREFGIAAPAHTAKWAGAMVEALVDALSGEHYNLIIEGTLRTSAVPMKTAALLRERGYSVD